MDWPKIKTILIGVLIITNLILGFAYIKEQNRYVVDNENNLSDVLALYKNKNIDISRIKLEYPRSIRSANVELETFNVDLIGKILGSSYSIQSDSFTTESQTLYFDDTHLLYFENNHSSRVKQDGISNLAQFRLTIDENERAKQMSRAKSYLESIDYPLFYDGYEISTLGKYTLISFYNTYNDFRFEESKTMIWLYEDEIIGLKGENILKNTITQGTKYDIISVDKVLYSILPKIEAGDRIVEMSLIYKLNDESLLVTDLIMGEALPYYKIVLESGQVFHVSAIQD
ncbi:MAG: hypothetical protein BGO41_05850 [Clostridiales bacterium 38-18]|nr:MAG: hypothetical protein BGO41_05850 [Clostridiales bacterium 38-18]